VLEPSKQLETGIGQLLSDTLGRGCGKTQNHETTFQGIHVQSMPAETLQNPGYKCSADRTMAAGYAFKWKVASALIGGITARDWAPIPRSAQVEPAARLTQRDDSEGWILAGHFLPYPLGCEDGTHQFSTNQIAPFISIWA
jgi:hypothetical protein